MQAANIQINNPRINSPRSKNNLTGKALSLQEGINSIENLVHAKKISARLLTKFCLNVLFKKNHSEEILGNQINEFLEVENKLTFDEHLQIDELRDELRTLASSIFALDKKESTTFIRRENIPLGFGYLVVALFICSCDEVAFKDCSLNILGLQRWLCYIGCEKQVNDFTSLNFNDVELKRSANTVSFDGGSPAGVYSGIFMKLPEQNTLFD